MRSRRRIRPYGLLFVVACSGVACNELLDIQEASVDPRLDADDDSGQGAVPATGGSAGNGGSSGSSGTGGGGGDASTSGGSAGMTPSEDGGQSGAGLEPPSAGAGGDAEPIGGNAGAPAAGGTSGVGGGGAGGTGGTVGGTVSEGGAAGADSPVSMCETYCKGVMSYCVGALQQYVDEDQCMKVCELLPQGTLGETTGNTVACRLKKSADARYASGVERGLYCRQAGPGGDGGCGSNCEGFCSLMEGVCNAQSSPLYRYANAQECLTACAALPDGEIPYNINDEAVADGNSVQCRIFHVNSAAMLDPLEHCEHAMGFTLCEEAAASEHEH